MSRLLVIGGASLDVLHFQGQTAKAAGGSGLYSAAAAYRMGASVTMYAPRPVPMPPVLQPFAERVEWIGPTVAPSELPHFEIAHYGAGRSETLKASMGSELMLDPAGLPPSLSAFDHVHIVPLGTATLQLAFLRACRQRGAQRISVGTYDHIVADERERAWELLRAVDAFFMNRREAEEFFGSLDSARSRPGCLILITMGDQGALVVQGEHHTHLPAPKVEELDPTGAGDSFCGATLVGLMRGQHPIMAARCAIPLAADIVQAIGPAALLKEEAVPAPQDDPRIRLNQDQLERVAGLIASLPDVAAYDFVGEELPPAGHSHALAYFFATTLQQFGFWEMEGGGYSHPLIAPIQGVSAKGSDYLSRAYTRELETNGPDFFAPETQAALNRSRLKRVFRSDDGDDPLPALDLHLSQARAYGADMSTMQLTPEAILQRANQSADPLAKLLGTLDHIGGYKEDPLRKKSALLALILAQRPEGFLSLRRGDRIPPIIDYHLMRSCLRIGLLDILDGELEDLIVRRRALEPGDEWAIRYAAYRIIGELVERSGKSMGAVDWLFFNARRRCPEMVEPMCEQCPVDPACAHRVDLFQPVLRTTFY